MLFTTEILKKSLVKICNFTHKNNIKSILLSVEFAKMTQLSYNFVKNNKGYSMAVEIFKELVLFSLDQINAHIKIRNQEYHQNNKLEQTKPIVYRENLALYEEEELYLQKTRSFIQQIDASSFESPDEFKDVVLKNIQSYYHENGVPNVCYVILTEKIDLALDFYNNLIKD